MDTEKFGYLSISLKLRGFRQDAIKWLEGIPRGKNSETNAPLPIRQDLREKISLEVRFSTAGEVVWFPTFLPAGDKLETHKPKLKINGEYSLEIHEGQEGAIVIAEECGDGGEFQVTIIDLWEPIWISSYFGNRDAIAEHFGGQRRKFVLHTIAAMDYRVAEKQRAEEERRNAEQERLEEKRREEERKRSEEEKKQERKRGLLGQLMSLTRGGWKSR